jgi:hypothetical protein
LLILFLGDASIKYRYSYDGDRDGFMSSLFGGPDHNGSNALIFPEATETPGDNMNQHYNNMNLSRKNEKDYLITINRH